MNVRVIIAALSFSAAGLAGLALKESYTANAVIPIPGDRPTIGFGSTFKEDGSPVKMGDTITPPKALARTLNHIQKDETVLRQCVKAPLSQAEYDILVDFAYWFGSHNTCNLRLVKEINAGRYREACDTYLTYRTAAKKDCSIPVNGCRGVWLRAQERHAKCMAAQ